MSSNRDTTSTEAPGAATTLGAPSPLEALGTQGDPGAVAVGASRSEEPSWDWGIWRSLPVVIVLGTAGYILLSNWGQLMANHWAYPTLLWVVVAVCVILLIRARPRRRYPTASPVLGDANSDATPEASG